LKDSWVEQSKQLKHINQQQHRLEAKAKQLAHKHDQFLAQVRREKERTRRINNEKLYRQIEITAWLMKQYARSLSTLAIVVVATSAIALPTISYLAIRFAASDWCRTNACAVVVDWIIHDPPDSPKQNSQTVRSPRN
jgi:hypothetical protein